MPYYPSESDDKAYFQNQSIDIKIVSDYTGLDFHSVDALDLFEYFGYLHDAVVWNCGKTEAGREYLENAYYNSQTKPDRKALGKMLGGDK